MITTEKICSRQQYDCHVALVGF